MKPKFVLQWHLTHQCNLRCSHCYQDDYMNSLNIDNLNKIFYQYLEFIDYFNYKGHINFTGGEPFLLDYIWTIFDLCEKNNITFGILTNGTLITDEIVNKLQKYQCLSFVQISLDGKKDTHEKIRGLNTFQIVLQSIKKLRKANIQTMIAFTCHKDNYKELIDVIKIVKKNKVDRFWVDRLIPLDETKKQRDRLLSTKEYRWVIKTLTKERNKTIKNPFCKTTIHTNRALQFCEGSNEHYQCSAGIKLLTILANGDLLPCRRLPIVIGNVLEQNLLTIYQQSDIIQTLQLKQIPKECNSCLNAETCRGGAKCLSYALFKDINKKDYNCYF